jgi:hypothetical protein
MDPYLEAPHRWSSLHAYLIPKLAEQLAPQLGDRYAVSIEERVYLSFPPSFPDDELRIRRPDAMILDLERRPAAAGGAIATLPRALEVLVPAPEPMRELYLAVRGQDEEVVTAIELLSPTNKRPGPGRDEYVVQRSEVLRSRTNLVEIDLLRGGPRMPMVAIDPEGATGEGYGVLFSRGVERPRALFIPFAVREPFPRFPVPRAPGDPEPALDLRPALLAAYDTLSFARRIDYSRPPDPPFSTADEAWAGELLRAKGLRE